MSNYKQSSLEWYIIERHDLEINSRLGEIEPVQYGEELLKLEQQAREMYRDEIEAAAIISSAEQSTSDAHNKDIHRQQIIQAYIDAKMERNLVKKHFAYFLKLERVQIAAQEYYNKTYNTK